MQFIGIRSEGGLLPPDILEQIAQEKLEGQKATAFGLPAGRRLTDEIARAWSDALDYWNVFRRRSQELPEKDPFGTTLTRERWVTRLLQDLLGYDQLTYQPSAAVVNGRNFPISHRAGLGEDGPPVHIEGFKTELEKRPESRRLSPQALVQDYLNNSDEHDWGIVTNGIQFRLLRDTSRTSRPTYLEFNLQSILDGANFNEFVLFYRLCHRTRLPKPGQSSSESLLEKYYLTSVEQGGRVRDHLRDSVEDALKVLGTGFLKHPKNVDLSERAKSGKLTPQSYHRQLLRLVYRFLFLMVAEERRMVLPEEPESERRWRIYSQNYSIHRLRKLAATRVEKSEFGDLWLGLKHSFRLFEDGDANPLGIPPLNGDLFSDRAIKDLQTVQLKNDDLLLAMHKLSLFEKDKMLQWINYSGLDVEELGSVYESLLDFQPVFEPEGDLLRFNLRTGSERKSTGSYYTRPELVRELIESALIPVMEDRLAEARKRAGEDKPKQRDEQIKAILSITVCDPACGSGHFLLAAARRLGRELAKIKTGEEEPTPKGFHLAVRDVITHCIYGVDQNPLAVDLCKLALWLEGHWTGKPLSFLDHRIKCGNSLIGVLNPKVLIEPIPDDAYTAVTGDVKAVAAGFRKRNKEQRKEWTRRREQGHLRFDPSVDLRDLAAEAREISSITENSPADVRRKAQRYGEMREGGNYNRDLNASHLWTAVFFSELEKENDQRVPTTEELRRCLEGLPVNGNTLAYAFELAEECRFFHWRLEFPEVFERGGFDTVIGNPPWERIKLQEEEHWIDDPYISAAANKAQRARRIQEYRGSDDPGKTARVHRFDLAKHNQESFGRFVRHSGRWPLTAVGDVNTYAIFAELGTSVVNPTGRLGLILPVNIATDDTTKRFFSNVAESKRLVCLIGFENEAFIFPAVHHAFKFCALVIAGEKRQVHTSSFVFFCRLFSQVEDPKRRFELTAEDFKLLNPNTQTCPVFRTRMDAELTKKLYRAVTIFMSDAEGLNPWKVEFQRMFDMANDSGLFMNASGGELVPLYEGKMFWQFDHRFSTYEGASPANLNSGILPQPTDQQKEDPSFTVQPRYWVPRRDLVLRTSHVPPVLVDAVKANSEKMVSEVLAHWVASYCRTHGNEAGEQLMRKYIPADIWQSVPGMFMDLLRQDAIIDSWNAKWPLSEADLQMNPAPKSLIEFAWQLLEKRTPKWLVAFRDVTNATNERTLVCSALPQVAVGHKAPVIYVGIEDAHLQLCLIGSLNSLICDYVARQKIGGTSMSYFILKQIPVPSPNSYTDEDRRFLASRVAELVCTSDDLAFLAAELGVGSFTWSKDRREVLRSELDAYFAHLYGLSRDEMCFVLDPRDVFGQDFPSETFRVLKEREEKEFGEYRTRRLVLEAFDKLAESPRFKDEMPKRISAFSELRQAAEVSS
jgi:hypothetical protein